LTDNELGIAADTVFSALCHEARKADGVAGVERLVSLVSSGALLISDALPFIGDTLYLPKPIMRVERDTEVKSDSNSKKLFKKLRYIAADSLREYVTGEFDAQAALSVSDSIGEQELRARVTVGGDPYHVGVFSFSENAGLYVVVGYETDCDCADRLFTSLAYSGIGGKRTSGLGRFALERRGAGALETYLGASSARSMTLSVCMAGDDELDAALDGATFQLKRRGGFVSSPDYSDTPLKKKDFYSFAAGSCFVNRFTGGVFDVSRGGSHPVYRYAKPMFMGVDV
jgi:CRISPR-associated protein Csm4